MSIVAMFALRRMMSAAAIRCGFRGDRCDLMFKPIYESSRKMAMRHNLPNSLKLS
jgi:hypothetical protein